MSTRPVYYYWPSKSLGTGGVEGHIQNLIQEMSLLKIRTSLISHINEIKDDDFILHCHGDKIPSLSVPESYRKNWIHTFHGTSFGRMLACREYLGISNYRAAIKEAYAAHASHAQIFVSHSVQDQVKRYYLKNETHNNNRVIYNGANVLNSTQTSSPFSKYQPYFCFLGRGDDNVKNTKGLQKAFSIFLQKNPNFSLLVAPGTGFDTHPNIIPTTINNEELKFHIYKNATAALLPSFYEADSLVVWESLAYGTRVLATNALKGSAHLKEKENCIFVNPQDCQSIVQGLEWLSQIKNRPQPYVRSWKKVAEETATFYESIWSSK